MNHEVSEKDRRVLREVARRQMEIAQSEGMARLRREWLLHNTFRGGRPMVHVELWTFGDEIVPPLLRCEGEAARGIESRLYGNFVNHELFADDYPVPDCYPVRPRAGMRMFGLDQKREESGGLGFRFVPQLNDLEEDEAILEREPEYFCDIEGAQRELDEANELFGDILPAKLVGASLGADPTYRVVCYMGMENMLLNMCDYPELFLKMMHRIADATLGFFAFQREHGLILPTAGGEHLTQGSWCFTDELPGGASVTTESSGGSPIEAGRHLGPGDVWGYVDSQETVGVSPAMFAELIQPAYQRIVDAYGLLSYGCCEPVHSIYDGFLSKLKNLRKVSISPWCDEAFMGERLAGRRVVYHRKPSPNFLGVGDSPDLDEDAVRAHLRKTMEAASGCTLEVSQRDVYHVAHSPAKVRRYVELIRECAERWYKP